MKATDLAGKMALVAAVLAATTAARADWPRIHFDSNNNANTGTAATVTDVSTGAFWNTGAEDLAPGCRPIVADGKVFAVAMQFSPSERLWIKSFDPADGTLVGESADLDIGDASIFGTSYLGGDNTSVNLGTVSAPAVDAANGALYFATGATMYRLATADLSAVWSAVMSSSNTDATGTHGVVNSSPALGAGNVYIQTYPITFGGLDEAQLVAFDQTTGAVAWHAKAGGRGTASPLFVDLGASQYVITDAQPDGSTVLLEAYDANATGAATPVWTMSAPLNEPSSAPYGAGNHGQWGDFIFDGTSKIYGITSNFGGGRLYSVNAADGVLDWQVDVGGADVPPVLIGGDLYVLNSTNAMVRYATADGSVNGAAVTVISSSVFRDYFAAAADGIYLAKGGDGLQFFNPGTTNSVALQSVTASMDYTGPCTVDALNGYVYTHDGAGGLSVFTGVSSVSDWTNF